MSGPAGFLEFFILEAADYVEQLDGVLLRGGVSGPDGDALQRSARALRGTATMAKLPSFAEVASSIERVGRALQDGVVHWDPALGGALVAAVDDLKILLRGARNWSPSEEDRAKARAAELARYAPARPAGSAPAPAGSQASGAGANPYLATEASNIAAGMELLTTRAGDAETAANVLRRVRALRGVAGVKEIGPLADVLEATEEAARGLESREEQLSPEARQLLEASASYLRTLASALRGDGGDLQAPSSSRDAFNAALDAWATRSGERERVVPIADLFYADGAPGLVEASPNPPTSPAERFRLELVSLGEHLRQVIRAARRATDNASIVRSRRDLRTALRALQAAAESFDEDEVAAFVGEHLETASAGSAVELDSLEALATIITDPGTSAEGLRSRLAGRVAEHEWIEDVVDDASAGGTAGSGPTPGAPMERPTPPAPAAIDAGSAALIDSSIAALDFLGDARLIEPLPLPEDVVVPIESLLYRGRAALDRAVEIRDDLKRAGVHSDPDALDELFDLLELARLDQPA